MLKRISFALLSLLFLFPINAYAMDCSASSAIVVDADTMTILYEKNAYEQRSMASTTKIMTALLAIESNRLDDVVTITKEMVAVEGSALGLKAGDKLTLYDLVMGMMLTSGNDAANATAFFISGSLEGFRKLMNTRAEELGMKSTYFETPSGLDEGKHHSTAYDMAVLTAAAIKLESFCDIVSKRSAEITINESKITVYNHNKLLGYDKDIFGVKTGFTKKAGRCLVSAKKYNNNKMICVTLNAPDDWNDHQLLYKECQNSYHKVSISNTNVFNVVGSDRDTFNASYDKEYYMVGEVKFRIYYRPFYYAPIKKGEQVGEVWVYNNNKLIERLPIEADEDVEYGRKE